MEVFAAAMVAWLYDPTFFDEDLARWELLVPVFGLGSTKQFVSGAGTRGSVVVTQTIVRESLRKGALTQLQRIALKTFGLMVSQRAVMTKTLPLTISRKGTLFTTLDLCSATGSARGSGTKDKVIYGAN